MSSQNHGPSRCCVGPGGAGGKRKLVRLVRRNVFVQLGPVVDTILYMGRTTKLPLDSGNQRDFARFVYALRLISDAKVGSGEFWVDMAIAKTAQCE
eukprot:6097703-Amphidinium_carterae.2